MEAAIYEEMKVLWVSNTIFPDACEVLGISPPVGGGWMYGMASRIALSDDVELAVAAVYSGKEPKTLKVNGVLYFLLPGRDLIALESEWRRVINGFKPNLIHIHGTEYSHGLALMNACPELSYVVSIQGLVSVCYRYYLAGLGFWDVFRNITIRDLLRQDTLFQGKWAFHKRGLVEREYIKRATLLMGRTKWDHAHVKYINDNSRYVVCNESLRDEFYSDAQWRLDSCKKKTIFLSQGGYPLKGLHQVIKAIGKLKQKYPDIMVYVAGANITDSSTWRARFARSGYGSFIVELIKKYDVADNLYFLGEMTAEQMRDSYLSANVFICPSSIENSSNSLGEAQILGVPSIASYVGGTPSMVADGETCLLYRFEEFEMLADLVEQVFEQDDLALKLSNGGRLEALARHNRDSNLDTLLSIYRQFA